MGYMDDLERAIGIFKNILDSTPKDNKAYGRLLYEIGVALSVRLELTESVDDRKQLIELAEEAAERTASAPETRFRASLLAAEYLIKDNSNRANRLLRLALSLLLSYSRGTLNGDDQQYDLSLVLGLTSTAASIAIKSGDDPYRVLEVLEMGRGVTASLQLDTRADITLLQQLHPDIAQEFERLRQKLIRRNF